MSSRQRFLLADVFSGFFLFPLCYQDFMEVILQAKSPHGVFFHRCTSYGSDRIS